LGELWLLPESSILNQANEINQLKNGRMEIEDSIKEAERILNDEHMTAEEKKVKIAQIKMNIEKKYVFYVFINP